MAAPHAGLASAVCVKKGRGRGKSPFFFFLAGWLAVKAARKALASPVVAIDFSELNWISNPETREEG